MKINATLPDKGRDLRLDLFRGVANWAIFLDHIPDNVVNWITTRNYGFSDAADLFVFISGYTASFVFARIMLERGFVIGATRLIRRAWQIYVAHIVLLVMYIAEIGYLAHRYGDRVKRFATVNEPSVFTLFGFCLGGQAPGIVDRSMLLRAIHHVNLGHGAAVDRLRATVKNASIGAIHNCQPCKAGGSDPKDIVAAQTLDIYWNGAFPDPQLLGRYPPLLADAIAPYMQPQDLALICRPVDWFGLNHYSPHYVVANPDKPLGVGFAPPPAGIPRSSMGWPVEPDAFRQTLIDLHRRYRLPIYVLENGTAHIDKFDDSGAVTDQPRIDFLRAYTDAMFVAIDAGVDIRGYFVWSLLDNFEWGSGYSQRFGLVYVDYATQRRIPKESFGWYSQLIKTHQNISARAGTSVAT